MSLAKEAAEKVSSEEFEKAVQRATKSGVKDPRKYIAEVWKRQGVGSNNPSIQSKIHGALSASRK